MKVKGNKSNFVELGKSSAQRIMYSIKPAHKENKNTPN